VKTPFPLSSQSLHYFQSEVREICETGCRLLIAAVVAKVSGELSHP